MISHAKIWIRIKLNIFKILCRLARTITKVKRLQSARSDAITYSNRTHFFFHRINAYNAGPPIRPKSFLTISVHVSIGPPRF